MSVKSAESALPARSLEETLFDYTGMELHQLQTNMMLIRDAFLYPSEGDMGQLFRLRRPMFFAMHGRAL
ncbi:hypothetical protein JCM24511_10165 [Saitozyma sp. JCM 24511]|nr:hypothetical protein JCM24511_10165 [Saitozyma sp. JCM 24511]